MSSVTVTIPPASRPVNVAELKAHLRIMDDDGSQDILLGNLIDAATSTFERKTNTSVMARTLRLSMDRFPAGCRCGSVIYLPKPPFLHSTDEADTGVKELAYRDSAGTRQTLDPSRYQVDADHEPTRITPAFDMRWPTTRRMLGAVTVTYAAGYGDAAGDVPEDVKAAIKMIAAHWYEHAEAASALALHESPMAVGTIIEQHRFPEV